MKRLCVISLVALLVSAFSISARAAPQDGEPGQVLSYRAAYATNSQKWLQGVATPIRQFSATWSFDAMAAVDTDGTKVWGGFGFTHTAWPKFAPDLGIAASFGLVFANAEPAGFYIALGGSLRT